MTGSMLFFVAVPYQARHPSTCPKAPFPCVPLLGLAGQMRLQMSATVHDNTKSHRFELDVNGTTAFIRYSRSSGVVTLIHTEVPESLSGQGVGSNLARGTLELLRARGARIVPECPFVAAYIRKHPEFADLVDGAPAQSLDARLDEALQETFPASDPPAVTPEK